MRRETLGEIFQRSPEEALEEAFRRSKEDHPYRNGEIFVWQSQLGLDRKVRYGSYKHLRRQQLVGREYKIEFLDYAIGIFWLDVLHDPRTYKNVPISSLPVTN